MASRVSFLVLAACAVHASAAASGGLPISGLGPHGAVSSSIGSLRAWGRAGGAGAGSLRLRGGMMIYKDIVSGDEMISDSFPLQVVDDVMLKVESKFVVKDALDVNIGGNPATEAGEEDEGVDDQAVKVNDIVDAFNLKSMGCFDKKGILAWVKGYLKAIKERLEKENPERCALFQEKSQKWVKDVLLKNPADFEFYSGASYNTEGALAMFVYEGENVSPHVYLFKDGLKEEKC